MDIGFGIQVPSEDGQPGEGGDHFGSGEVESIYKSLSQGTCVILWSKNVRV